MTMQTNQTTQTLAIDDAWRDTLLGREDYLAGPDFEKACYWKKHSGDFWNELLSMLDPGQPFPLTIVGRIVPRRLYMDTRGNYTGKYNQKLSQAKFQFSLTKPIESPKFARDWDIALSRIEQLENEISKGNPKKYLIIDEDGERRLRMSADMFGLRTEPLSSFNEHDPTVQWPMPAEYMPALKTTAPMYEIHPPRIYDSHDHRVAPIGMQAYMNGSLAEVTFTMKQCTVSVNEEHHSTFSGIFQQVRIIRRPPPVHRNVYDRPENQGPYIPRQISERHRGSRGDEKKNDSLPFKDCEPGTTPPNSQEGLYDATDNQPEVTLASMSSSSPESSIHGDHISQTVQSDMQSSGATSTESGHNSTGPSPKALGKRKATDEEDEESHNRKRGKLVQKK